MRGRPNLYVSYEEEQRILPTATQRVAMGLLLLVAFSIPFKVVPGLRFLGERSWLQILGLTFIFMIAALGLNILTGLAGQVSLGHAFFMGVGAYTAAVLGGESTIRKSSSPHSTSARNCLIMLYFRGPRQMTGASIWGRRKPIDIATRFGLTATGLMESSPPVTGAP